MIYNVSGTGLSECYDIDGTNLEYAYDVDGTEVFSGGGYSIENVISYLREPTLSVAAEIKGLSCDWQSFVHIPDPHGDGNQQHSQAIGLYLIDNTPSKFIVLGGDYFAGAYKDTEYHRYMDPLINSEMVDKIYPILGNHDAGWQSFDPDTCKQALYDDFLKDKSNISGSLTDNYYYFDDAETKTRFMLINTSDVGLARVGDTQLAWIEQNVVLPDSSWSLWVIGHFTLNTMGGITYENEDNGADVVSAILNCNGTIVGYLCGHQHIDLLYDDGNVHHTTLICDRMSNTNWYPGISVIDRDVGTASEQAVSVISFNTKTKDVVIRRIGAGRQNTLSYNYA